MRNEIKLMRSNRSLHFSEVNLYHGFTHIVRLGSTCVQVSGNVVPVDANNVLDSYQFMLHHSSWKAPEKIQEGKHH